MYFKFLKILIFNKIVMFFKVIFYKWRGNKNFLWWKNKLYICELEWVSYVKYIDFWFVI